jgi:glycosyltransferase involved in cell wall biosynthesis
VFSVVIITLNEERNIQRLLDSVKGLTDDVVIVDSGSTDATVQIALSGGARVFEYQWEGYAATKNFANSLAKYPWVLSMDADEALSKELHDSVRHQFHGNLPMNTVFYFNRLANYCGRWIYNSGWYPDRKMRLWHRDFGHWEGHVHERLVFKDAPVMRYLSGDLLHYSYYTVEEHKSRTGRYAELAAEAMYRKGRSSSFLKIWLAPVLRFMRDYIVKGGFLDGKAGFTMCRITASGVFHKYRELQKLTAGKIAGNR